VPLRLRVSPSLIYPLRMPKKQKLALTWIEGTKSRGSNVAALVSVPVASRPVLSLLCRKALSEVRMTDHCGLATFLGAVTRMNQ